MKKYIKSSNLDLKPVIIQFGDGNSAASRGLEPEHDCEISGNVSSSQLALAAGYFVDWLDSDFTDEDIINCIEDEGESIDTDWEDMMYAKDIGDGSPIVYRILFNGQEIYYDEGLEEEVKSSCDDDEYDD